MSVVAADPVEGGYYKGGPKRGADPRSTSGVGEDTTTRRRKRQDLLNLAIGNLRDVCLRLPGAPVAPGEQGRLIGLAEVVVADLAEAVGAPPGSRHRSLVAARNKNDELTTDLTPLLEVDDLELLENLSRVSALVGRYLRRETAASL